MIWTALPDQFDATIFTHGLDLISGRPINKRAAALSACNVAGYACHLFVPADAGPVVFHPLGSLGDSINAKLPTTEEFEACRAAFTAVGSSQEADAALPWDKLLPIVLQLLKLIFSR